MKYIVLIFSFFASTCVIALSQPTRAQTILKNPSTQGTKAQTTVPMNTPTTTTAGSKGYLKIKVQGVDVTGDGNPDPSAYKR